MSSIKQLTWQCFDCLEFFPWDKVYYIVDDVDEEGCVCVSCSIYDELDVKEW